MCIDIYYINVIIELELVGRKIIIRKGYMNIKSLMFAVVIYTSISLGVDASDWSGSVTVDYMSRYIGFGNGAVFYDKPMMQTDLYLQHKSGFHADIWWGTGFNSDFIGSGWDDEIDWNIGYGNTARVLGRKVSYDLTIGYWDVFDTFFHDSRNDIIHICAEVGVPFDVRDNLSLTPFAKVNGYTLPFGTDYEEGAILSAGTKYSWEFAKNLKVTGLTSFGHDDGGFGFQKGWIWKDYINLEWTPLKNFTWKAFQMQLYVPLTMTDRKVELVFGTGIILRF